MEPTVKGTLGRRSVALLGGAVVKYREAVMMKLICGMIFGVAISISILIGQGTSGGIALQNGIDRAIASHSKSDWLDVAKVVSKDKNRRTSPIISAIYFGNERAALFFIDQGYSVSEVSNIDGTSPLLLASYESSEALCLKLLKKTEKVHVNHASMRGRTPLHNACLRGFPRLATALIDRGANTNSRTQDGDTPLMMVAASQSPSIVICDRLLRFGADRSLINNFGATAFDIAARTKKSKQLLMKL